MNEIYEWFSYNNKYVKISEITHFEYSGFYELLTFTLKNGKQHQFNMSKSKFNELIPTLEQYLGYSIDLSKK